MEDDTQTTGRQIDAAEANRMAQEINRQVYQDIPEYSPEREDAPGPGADQRQEAPSDVDRDPPDRELTEDTFPPRVGESTTIGGSAEDRAILKEEEQR